ncbi:MAG TPA: vWA domain-containing protein [Gaiellaceae bacterium]|nr:vWA domain-containing protein [Gaiellaceae bacterium]
MSFLTPVALLFGLLAAIPLAVFVGRRRRSERIRSTLGLGPSPARSWIVLAASLAAVPALVAVAAAQPVVTSARTVPQRSDAEVFVVVDTSRSMLASSGAGEPTRFDRALDGVLALQEELPGVPVGLASFTDRVLPHLFPTVDRRVFTETTREALGIEKPPPSTSFGTNVTTLDALGAIPTLAYFTPSAKRRAVVVFTDGESQPVSTLASDFAKRPRIDVTFVRVGDASEQIFESGVAEAGYSADPAAPETLAAAAEAVEGRVLSEEQVDDAAGAVRAALGTGPTVPRRIEGSRRALMPYVALLAIFPLGFVLYRRNL